MLSNYCPYVKVTGTYFMKSKKYLLTYIIFQIVTVILVWGQNTLPFVVNSAPKTPTKTHTFADGSSATAWSLQTVPGVEYTIQISDDLVTWTNSDVIYGLGHEVVTPMFYTQAPPQPVGPPPPAQPRKKFVSLLMRPCLTGGIVVSWKSMVDNSFKVMHLPSLTLVPEWQAQILYCEPFGEFYMWVNHLMMAQEAPASNSQIASGSLDAGFIDGFVEFFPTMNQQVSDHAALAAMAPPPPPTPPGGKKFWRTIANWSLDSDLDGSPDWIELQNLLQGGANASLAIADPANPDTNNDGIADGKQQDFDNDAIPDAEDACPYDPVIKWKTTRPTRYALFDVPLVYDTQAYNSAILGIPLPPVISPPIGINSMGIILYTQGTFYQNVLHPLPDATDMLYQRPYSINDAGSILGYGSFDNDQDTQQDSWGAVIWPNSTTAPFLVASGNHYASPTYGMSYDLLNFGADFSKDGSFIAETYEKRINENNQTERINLGHELWRLGTNGSYVRGGLVGNHVFCENQNTHWGWSEAGHLNLTTETGTVDLGFQNQTRLQRVGENLQPVLHGGTSESLFFHQNTWQKSFALQHVLAISDDGIAVTDKAGLPVDYTGNMNFWLNNTYLTPAQMIPGIPSYYLDDRNAFLYGMANRGQVLLGHQSEEGNLLHTALGQPCSVEDDVRFTGVDDFSIGATDEDPASKNKIWIMAPAGEGNKNTVFMHCRGCVTNPLKISSPLLSEEIDLTTDNQSVEFHGIGTESQDTDLIMKLGTAQAINSPIGIKIMKHRTVNVTIHPVAWQDTNDSTKTIVPSQMPTLAEISAYLNKIYEKQINAHIEVTIKPLIALDYSKMNAADMQPNNFAPSGGPVLGDKRFDVPVEALFAEQLACTALKDLTADINVYVMGAEDMKAWYYDGRNLNRWNSFYIFGVAWPSSNEAWVDGTLQTAINGTNLNTFTPATKKMIVLNTIAHEMGHVIVGLGHPDQGKGPCPLAGTFHLERLMVSGGTHDYSLQSRLVKGEWDEAEKWLKNRPNGDY
jgi:hypothetical protein